MWNEIVKNEIWEIDDFINEETVEHIKREKRLLRPYNLILS